jgi:hypothetical protein
MYGMNNARAVSEVRWLLLVMYGMNNARLRAVSEVCRLVLVMKKGAVSEVCRLLLVMKCMERIMREQ